MSATAPLHPVWGKALGLEFAAPTPIGPGLCHGA